jgi:D-alanyl-D-alanine carboxypeptidase
MVLTLFSVSAPAYANEKYAAIVFDANSGRTLFARHADEKRYPASLTKMMTLYIIFEELEAGRLKLDSRLSVSANAARQAPSKLGVRAGTKIKVEDAILALITKSANDVAVVVAENIEGSVADFAARMTRTARALGMTHTTFRNPHGLPNSAQVTTARDLVRLATVLQDKFPEYYPYFGRKSFSYRGARYRNHNRLLGSVEGVDGIKTGYTRASGFNLVTNIERDGRHIVAVVMGGRTAASRDAHMRELIKTHMKKAARGDRSRPLIVADAATIEPQLPRARPQTETQPSALLSYAAAEPSRDVVTAALAETADPEGDAESEADNLHDPIAERISTATELALAYAAPVTANDDRVERLAEFARIQSGQGDIVAGAPESSEKVSDQEAWHIQIGAVPSAAEAETLIEKAQASMARVLASYSPLTQTTNHEGTLLYRARFAGFAGKEEARATCEKLKSKDFACLAVPN